MSLIELVDVEFSYGRNPVLRIPRFEVETGEKIFLHGPSGSGKSTFLEILSGILSPQQGRVSVLGRDLSKLLPGERDRFRADHIGSVFQSFNLIPYLNVRENIDLGARFGRQRKAKVTNWSEERQELAKALAIDHLLERSVLRLSVGQQQRVAAARAFLGSPEVILADEPTSALDEENREKFLSVLFELARARRCGVVFVSHDRSIQNRFDRVIALRELNEAAS